MSTSTSEPLEEACFVRATWDKVLLFSFSIVLIVCLIFVIFRQTPLNEQQWYVCISVLALGAAGFAAFLPGSISWQVNPGLKAGGAFAVLLLIVWRREHILMTRAEANVSCLVITRRILSALIITLLVQCVWSQSAPSVQREPNLTWAGRRIVTLAGFGDYFAPDANGQAKLVKPDGLGVNIVAVVERADGDRIWIKANGAGHAPVGWVRGSDAILLENAVPYFTSRIDHNPNDWDAYLRRAEAEDSLNQRETAIVDYTRAIELHPNESFLFLRRGRAFRIVKDCPRAAADFEEAARLRPQWAEAYNLEAGVYADCPDPTRRDPAKAIQLIKHAIALSPNPTYVTVLALAYFRSGDPEKAVVTQKQALESSRFPPGYREEALRQLHEYENAATAQKH